MLRALLLWVLLALCGELVAAALTGRDPRSYTVLPPDAVVTDGDRELDLASYAAQYVPVLRVDPANLPPDVETIWYQAVVRDDMIILVYYVQWENEIHSSPVVHRLYELYRRAVYGSVHDIEYIELHIDRTTGIVHRMRFETASDGDYNRQQVTHFSTYLNYDAADGGYDYCVTGGVVSGEGLCLSDNNTTWIAGVWNVDRRPVLGVMTWNHLYTLLPDDDYGPYTHVIDAPLRYLTDDVFEQEKLARRSQGDLTVSADPTLRNVLRGVFWGLSALLVGYWGLRGLRA